MPCWWPNHLIDWLQIKNLSHRYEGYLGNTYSNCLRIAVIRGYAHYGLDANDYVEKQNGRSSSGGASNGLNTSSAHQNTLNDASNESLIYLDDVSIFMGFAFAGIVAIEHFFSVVFRCPKNVAVKCSFIDRLAQ